MKQFVLLPVTSWDSSHSIFLPQLIWSLFSLCHSCARFWQHFSETGIALRWNGPWSFIDMKIYMHSETIHDMCYSWIVVICKRQFYSLHSYCIHTGIFRLAMKGVFTSNKYANTTTTSTLKTYFRVSLAAHHQAVTSNMSVHIETEGIS